jgi:hypothetical protein
MVVYSLLQDKEIDRKGMLYGLLYKSLIQHIKRLKIILFNLIAFFSFILFE